MAFNVLEENWITTRTLAKVLMISVDRVRQLEEEGYLTSKLEKNKKLYDLVSSVQMYIKYKERSGKIQGALTVGLADAMDDGTRRLKAEADLKEAKAAIETLKKEEFEATMHRSEDVETVMEDLIMAFRAEALAIPGAVAVDVAEAQTAQEASGIIKAAVNNMLNRLSDFSYDPNVFKRLVREREKWMNEQSEEGSEEEGTDSGGNRKTKSATRKGMRRTKGT